MTGPRISVIAMAATLTMNEHSASAFQTRCKLPRLCCLVKFRLCETALESVAKHCGMLVTEIMKDHACMTRFCFRSSSHSVPPCCCIA